MDWIDLPYTPSQLRFQQETDGLRIFSLKTTFLLRQNLSRALYIPSHLALAKEYGQWPTFFVRVYEQYQSGNERVVEVYKSVSTDMLIEVIREILKVCIE